MKIVIGRPWFYFLLWLSGLRPKVGAIYTWGQTIYAPGSLTVDLVAHERTHTHQQGWFPAWWWLRYAFSADFRHTQEAEAYAAQFAVIQDRIPRRYHGKFLHDVARLMASDMYKTGRDAETSLLAIKASLLRLGRGTTTA